MDGYNGRCLPDGKKGMRRPGEIEDVKKKIHARAKKVLWHGIGIFVWAMAVGGGGGWRQLQEIQWEKKESKKTSETPQGRWLSGALRGSLWLCYAKPLAEKRKSEISGKRHRPKPIPWEKNSWGN